MTDVSLWVPMVLAFQVWDGVGWAARVVWGWRTLHQWAASEREGRSVLPASFWSWSLFGTCLDLIYLFYKRDPVFVSGTLVNGSIYARNLWVSTHPSPTRRPARVIWPVLAGLAVFAAVVIEAIGPDHGLVRFDRKLLWLVVGFLGQACWTGRFVIQWWESERKGVSHLPAAFFKVGLAGACLLTVYALSQKEWVMLVGSATPIPAYLRNLVLIRRGPPADGGNAAVLSPKPSPPE